jgi:uncharacterized damage-inducible protein DinB
MKRASLALAALLVAAPLSAQMDHGDGSVAGVKGLYETVRGYIVAAAEQMPEDKYSYQPTDEVRTFGQILGHVANAGYMFCAPVRGQEAPSMPNAEELTTKAEIVAALKGSFEYCDQAHDLNMMDAASSLQFFGQQHTKLSVLAFNIAHDFEHYGNLVTYLRLNGMVPPSSQRSGM